MKQCEHKNTYPDYFVDIKCSTPYCYGYEVHCKDCRRFIVTCDCYFLNGESGWPEARWRKFWRKKRKEQTKCLV